MWTSVSELPEVYSRLTRQVLEDRNTPDALPSLLHAGVPFSRQQSARPPIRGGTEGPWRLMRRSLFSIPLHLGKGVRGRWHHHGQGLSMRKMHSAGVGRTRSDETSADRCETAAVKVWNGYFGQLTGTGVLSTACTGGMEQKER